MHKMGLTFIISERNSSADGERATKNKNSPAGRSVPMAWHRTNVHTSEAILLHKNLVQFMG